MVRFLSGWASVGEGLGKEGELTWEPVLERGEVRRRRRLAGLEDLDGAAGVHGDRQASWGTEALLRARQDSIELPLVKAEILSSNTAHAIDDEERLRADALDELRQALKVGKHTRRGIHVRDRHELILLLLERLLDLRQLRAAADRGLDLRDVRAVGLEAVGEGVGEVPGVQHQGVVAGFGEVGGYEVPA